MKLRHFRDRIRHCFDPLQSRQHLSDPALERLGERVEDATVVDGTQRLRQARGAHRHERVGISVVGRVQQFGQKVGGQSGHIAGGHQVPLSPGVAQRGEDSAERSGIGVKVGNGWIIGQLGAAYDHYAACCQGDGARHGFTQCASTERQQRFIAPHPGAAAPRQHVARPIHREMIPLEFTNQSQWNFAVRPNILTRVCSTIWIGALLAGAALYGADAPAMPKRMTSVVRADPHSGRLVRSVIVTPRTVQQKPVVATVVEPRAVSTTPSAAPAPEPPRAIDEAVDQIAGRYDLRPELLHSVIKVESNYNPHAISSKGAQGLMQLIPATARRFGVGDVFNPVENIEGGAKYLRYLLNLYGGNFPLALAAYNAGEGAVQKYGGVPPYKETQNYLVLVKKHLDKAVGARKTPPAAPAAPAVVRDPSAPAHIQEIVEANGAVRYVSR